MIVFDPEDLFPLLDRTTHRYREAQAHSAQVDIFLGLEIEKIEAEIKNHVLTPFDSKLWIGLPSQILQTPYTEIRYLLSLLKLAPGDRVVDLGAAYGRMGLVIAKHHPGVEFWGYEFIAERVKEGSRAIAQAGSPLVHLEVQNLSDLGFSPPRAQVYFIYDFGSRNAIEKILNDLKTVAQTQKIRVVGRGRSSRDIIERSHPWLSQVIPPHHEEHFSIYSSK